MMLQASKVRQLCPNYFSSGNIQMMMTSASKDVQVSVTPASCLHDESVQIRAEGLAPNQDVTLYCSMKDTRNVHYLSIAHYKADDSGQVDVNTMESLGGSYASLFPMGLIGTLHPAPSEYKFTRFFKRDVVNPNILELSVYDGHLTEEEVCAPECQKPLASTQHERHYMGPGVQRIPVRYGKVRGTLFLPAGEGPFPGVVDMFGTAGGLLEYRSAQLASRGIASLALAFFAYDDLPKSLEEFNISYFEEAVEFLLKHEKILKPNVGAVGVSKGGDLVLSLATHIPEVKAGVWINGCNANVQSAFNLRDSVFPGLEFDLGKVKIEDGVMDCFETVNNPADYPETIIPIEKADANFLFLVGNADRNWKSVMYCDQAIERLKKAGRNNYEVHNYPGTGHLIEPPHSPFCGSSYHKLVRMPLLWGGKPQPHLMAQRHAWNTMLSFLRRCIR
ncbi:acyl-coenzyme A thioesterase 1-like isoform X3 [Penaeus japonicus]|uniref:acyl-coenzyme A thioesterase 1-like isoform X3 n=1 Tax=Penaeus japonicus TaxID=27405 RepID=UPI001C70F1F1|nr:acyl-coenzyme A thioesterase 1-like isoform X3 [Penaeus japonicus]